MTNSELIFEMLKNNRALWVTAFITGVFSIVVSLVNGFFIYKQKKKQLDFDKQLEKYRSIVGNKMYMTKAKFDAEFSMYQELSLAFATLVKECSQLFPTFTKDVSDDIEKYKRTRDLCIDVIVVAQDKLSSYAPFISESIYDKYFEIEKLCKSQLSDFEDFRLRPDAESYRKECSKEYRNTYKKTREINDKYKELSTLLREYLNDIDVMD